MNTTYSYEQIAQNYTLWTEFVDTDGNMSRETFDSTPVETLVAMMTDMFGADPNTRLTVSIDEDGVWATDAHIRTGKLDVAGWEDGATLLPDEDGAPSADDDRLYGQIADAIAAGDTDGRIEISGHVYTWRIS